MTIDVLFDYQIFSLQKYGGISRYIIELARHLQQIPDVTATIYGGKHHNYYLDQVHDEITVSGHLTQPNRSKLKNLFRYVENVTGFFSDASTKQFTHIHQTYYYGILPPISRARRIVTVYDMIHELFPLQFPAARRTSLAKRVSVSMADHVICISHSTRRDLIRLFGVPEEKCTAIPLGLSPVSAIDISDGRPRCRLSERPYILYVGSRDGYKNFDALLQAYATLPDVVAEFDIMCFGGGSLSDRERVRIAGLGIPADRVFHAGGDDDMLTSAYRHAEFLAYPSLYEGFGFPPLEAMAAACPVACSNTSSMPEVVGDAAVMFDPNSVSDIARALRILAENGAVRLACRDAGLVQAAKFTWARCAESTREVYARTM